MIAKLRAILAEISQPSAQRDSWFVWAAAQMAHALIGAVLAGALLFFLPPILAFTAAWLGYALLKELPDYRRAPGWAGARDSVQDALFVAAGAALTVAIAEANIWLFAISVTAAGAGLWFGVAARLK